MTQMFQNLHRTMQPSQTLKIQCDACRHLATLSHTEAVRLCGSDATPMDIRRRAKCRACRAEGRVQVWI
jgi:hypothetical protein